jgi:hypothetical protein
MTVAAEQPDRIGAGLRQVIDAVWAPDRTGVRVRVGGQPAQRSGCVERYFVLPHPRHPRLLLPADDLPSARRALAAYRGLRTVQAEAWSRVIRASVLSTPLTAGPLRQLRVYAAPTDQRLLPLLADRMEYAGRMRAMLAVRRAGPVSKPTLGLVDEDGAPICFAKLGRSALTDAMVRNEAATLRDLVGRLPTVVTPRLLLEEQWHGHPVSVMAPLPIEARRLAVEPLRMAHTMWEIAASSGIREQPLAGASYADRLEQRLDRCASSHPELAHAVMAWWQRLAGETGSLRFGRAHGDWVSWNLGTVEGRVVAWDWEASVPDAPLGFDACHWYFQRARAADGLEAAVAAVVDMAPGLTRVGVPADESARVGELYLAHMVVTELESAAAASESSAPYLADLAQVVRRRFVR